MDRRKHIFILAWSIFIILAVLNLLTVFTPEIGFDALWYHLTLPKLWLMKKQWYFPGGLLYYSAMPRLAETVFIPLIAITGSIGPKFVQFASGLGTAFLTYKVARLIKINSYYSSLAAFSFYITWLVSWQSGSAYIDLIRTFLEIFSLWCLFRGQWIKGGMLLGLAIGTKWLSLGSLFIYALVFGPRIIFPALFVASPWFYLAFRFTLNPIYPLFEPFLSHTLPAVKAIIIRLFLSPLYLTKPVDDFLTPLSGVFFILCLFSFFRFSGKPRKIAAIGILGTFFSLLPNPPSSRFFLPYLPVVVISAFYFLSHQSNQVKRAFQYLLVLSFLLILSLRLIAFKKYTPYLLGLETQNQFLTRVSANLPDTFIDSDSFIKDNLKGKKILIDKLHNLYYFPYDFDHTSWVQDYHRYDYLVTSAEMNNQGWELVHINQAGIRVYKIK